MRSYFEAEALEEYRDAAACSERKFGLGVQFCDAVEAAQAKIEGAPEQFRSVGDGIRVLRLDRFPYSLFYHFSPENEFIAIYAVVHDRREPENWRDRIE
ncbi:MAG: plasmid stabilization system protein ParE [Verrucomicrobiales bacterium]|jgi:plasmid stabilization system protein ParE